MVDVWEPAKAASLTQETIDRYVVLSESLDIESLELQVPESEKSSGARLMKLQAADWQLAEALTDGQLENLIRFFTKAEMQIPGWEAGKTSPVIYLAKIMKRRGSFTPECKQWVKSNTDNRYLPNGAVVL